MNHEEFESRISKAVGRLMATLGDRDTIRVSVPVLYPSGTGGGVEVMLNGDHCFVSDMGVGHTEAMLANASDFYRIYAKRSADRFGIGFDGDSMFMLRAPVDRIEGAIAAVANASVQAASISILRAEEDRERRRNDEVYDRVRSIFGPDVERRSDIMGRDASWPAHNVVSLPHGRKAIFEFVSGHANSISNKYMMFSDISKRNGQIVSLNAVVKDLSSLGVKSNILADVASIIQLSADNDDFIRHARAA